MFKVQSKVKTVLAISVICVLTFIMVPDSSFAVGNNRIVLTNVNSNLVLEKGTKHKITYKRYGKAKKGKIRFKSSNKKVVSVSRKGVLTAKKNGTARITVYVKIKGKKKYKRTVKIRVGARVQNITINGYECVKKGKTVSLSKSIKPSNAKNMAVTWSSENSKIAKVSSSGKVTGVNEGETVIKARAKDGSGVVARYIMHVYKLRKGDTKWVAHRGLHTKDKENTKAAFQAAGDAGFWGCECDIWEIPKSNDDPTIEFVINHDQTFERVFGVNVDILQTTADAIRNDSRLRGKVCFLEDFLDVCYKSGMVPVIEFKGTISYNAAEEVIDKVYEAAIRNGASDEKAMDFLKKTDWISFRSENLARVRDFIVNSEEYSGFQPTLTYLASGGLSDAETTDKVITAAREGYTTVSFNKGIITEEVAALCRANGLLIDVWYFNDTMKDTYKLHRIMKHSGYKVEHMTMNYKPW